MPVDALGLKLVSALQRYEALQRRADSNRDPSEVLRRTLAELGAALAELRVAEERIDGYRGQVTELQRELAEQRARYSALFDLIPEAFVVAKPDTTILEVNGLGGDLFNVSPRFLVGKTLSVFVCEDRAAFVEASTRIARDGGAARLTLKIRPRERAPVTVDAHVSVDSGALQWILKTAEP
jgi:PAS domain-containing protein